MSFVVMRNVNFAKNHNFPTFPYTKNNITLYQFQMIGTIEFLVYNSKQIYIPTERIEWEFHYNYNVCFIATYSKDLLKAR